MININKIEYDIKKTKEVIDGKVHNKNYKRVYFSSNENLPMLYENFDFKDKDVLTVLGSSDQLFHAYNSGAKHVDVFDKNTLAIYYLYLRIWVIEHYNKYYPNIKMNANYIKDLIEKVNPETKREYDKLQYWKRFVEEFPFYFSPLMFNTDKKGYKDNYLKDLSVLKERLSKRNFSFYNFDIQLDINLDKKYDLIIVSNISDYVSYMERYMNNLYNLLVDNGKILATNVCSCNPTKYEEFFFSEKFDIEKLPKTYHHSYEYPGYVYTKKM